MRKLYLALKIAVWAVIVLFLGSAGRQVWHYRTHPELYVINSAPWYTGILVSAVFAAAAVVILMIAMWIVRKRF